MQWALNSEARTGVVGIHSEFRIGLQWALNSEVRQGYRRNSAVKMTMGTELVPSDCRG